MSRDRGQMLLVGAVVIAVMILALVVVSNSALYTRNIDKGGAAESGREASEFGSIAQHDARSIAIRVNHGRRYETRPGLETALLENVTAYSDGLARSYVDSRSTYVDVSIDTGESTYGRRVLQDGEGEFTEPGSGNADWQVVGSAGDPRSDVGWLVVNLNVSELSTDDPFTITMTNDTGAVYQVSFQRNATGRVVVEATFSDSSHDQQVTCTPTRGRLLVDVLGGFDFGGSCSFNATEHLAAPYSVAVTNGDEAAGTYELVLEDAAALPPAIAGPGNDCTRGTTSADECWMPALWTLNVTATYQSSRIDYRRDWDLEVYNSTHGP